MPMCLPTPRIVWARDTATFSYRGLRWGSVSYWMNRIAAEKAVRVAHPTNLAGVVAQVTAASPNGCSPSVTQAGPFDNISHTGWWSGSGTIIRSTEVKGHYLCDKVPEGAIEYK